MIIYNKIHVLLLSIPNKCIYIYIYTHTYIVPILSIQLTTLIAYI